MPVLQQLILREVWALINQEISEKVYDLAGSAEIKTEDIGFRKLVHNLKPARRVLVELSDFVIALEANYATGFWDMKSTDLYIFTHKLPQPTNDKPVDAGFISGCAGLCKIKNIPSASMFAITLEKSGGSKSLPLSEMYVAGKVG